MRTLIGKARSFIWQRRQLYLPEDACALHGSLEARMFDSKFVKGDSCYNALHRAADGKIYFAIGTWRHDTAARLFCFDESSENLSTVGDFDAAVGARPGAAIPQGKVHVEFAEWDSRLYTATHIGFYRAEMRPERPGRLPGLAPYPGGSFLAFEPASSRFTPLSRAPQEEGIIGMTADPRRGLLYGVTWPGGLFVMSRTAPCELRSFGPVFGKGERGALWDGTWTPIPRTLGLDPRTGDVYWSDAEGRIFAAQRDAQRIETVTPGPHWIAGKAAAWRKVAWHGKENAFYGVLSRRSRLFRFDPDMRHFEPLSTVRPEAQRYASWWQAAPRATLAFHLASDEDMIRYLAVGPGIITRSGRRVRSTLSMFSYHIPSRTTRSHGIVRLDDGRYPTFAQSLMASHGSIYTVAWIELPDGSSSERVSELRKVRSEVQVPQLHGAIEEVNLIRFCDPVAGR